VNCLTTCRNCGFERRWDDEQARNNRPYIYTSGPGRKIAQIMEFWCKAFR
jgi:hypothetical protein